MARKVLLLLKPRIRALVIRFSERMLLISFKFMLHAFDFVLYLAYDYPDIEIVVGAGGLSGDISGAMRRMVGITDEFYRSVYRDIIGQVIILIVYNIFFKIV